MRSGEPFIEFKKLIYYYYLFFRLILKNKLNKVINSRPLRGVEPAEQSRNRGRGGTSQGPRLCLF